MSTKDMNPKGRPEERRRRKKRGGQDVVYTQPGPFNRNRFLLHLLTIIAVVLALTFAVSLFFTVKNVEIYGAQKYTPWQVREASGIKDGENLLATGRARISSLIEDKLNYADNVRVKIRLPDTVCIYIEELEVVYAAQAQDESWWLVRADGRVVDQTNAAEAERHTRLEGILLDAPQVGEQATAAEEAADATGPDGETVPVTVTGKERLEAALTIIAHLENNEIIGEAACIQVENLNDIQIWFGDQLQVLLGDTDRLDYKISAMKSVLDQMGQYQNGVMDASLTVDTGSGTEQVIFTPRN